jgi:hypothetical protein
MKKLMTYLAAGLLVIGAQSLMAQSTTNSAPANGVETAKPHRDRGAILRLVGLTPADVKGLTKEERQAKIKDAATTVQADLQAKKAAGTLTDKGQKRLDRIEKLLARLNRTAETQ